MGYACMSKKWIGTCQDIKRAKWMGYACMNRKWRNVVCGAIVLGVIGQFSNVYGNTDGKDKEHYVLTYAEIQTENYPTTQGAKYFADLVEQDTNGRIEIVVKTDGTLGTESEVLDQLRFGGIDFARIALSQFSDLLPEYNVLELPYLYENSEHMWAVLDGEIGDEFLDMSYKVDVVGLSWYDGGVRNFYTKEKPITCLEDFEGLKIRVQESTIMEAMINALGAEAVKVPYGDVYSYLERGMVDGAENSWPSYESMEHYEVAPYYTEDEHIRIPELQLISEHTWKQLSAKDQEIIRNAARKSAEYERKLWAEQVEKARNKVLSLGVEEIHLSDEEQKRIHDAIGVIYEKYSNGQKDVIERIQKMAEEFAEEH